YEQLSITDWLEESSKTEEEAQEEASPFGNEGLSHKERELRERRLQQAILSVQKRYGKNALLRGMNFEEGGTTIERNGQIGGHRA
ncbi:MAG: DNA methylase, partial [Lachnospiraceae bacterium]|nr:DNA methylase [Lachnospiraceae bacterium]